MSEKEKPSVKSDEHHSLTQEISIWDDEDVMIESFAKGLDEDHKEVKITVGCNVLWLDVSDDNNEVEVIIQALRKAQSFVKNKG